MTILNDALSVLTTISCMINVDGKNEQLDILDTAGQEQFAALQDHWIREAEAFVLVYSVTAQRTFLHADELFKKIQRNKVFTHFLSSISE